MQQKGQRRREKGVAAVHLGNAGERRNKGKEGAGSAGYEVSAAVILHFFSRFFFQF